MNTIKKSPWYDSLNKRNTSMDQLEQFTETLMNIDQSDTVK